MHENTVVSEVRQVLFSILLRDMFRNRRNFVSTVESGEKLWDDWAVFQGAGMGKLTLLLLVLLGWLQYSLWLGKNGVHDYTRVNDDVAVQQANNAKLKARNDQLFAEIDDLNGGSEAIEERARNELGMIKPGETFFRLVPDQNKRNTRQSAPGQPLKP